ncbi:putative phage tail protein [Paenibacillus algorifonticola]|uniref:putative phage tail protein n=1 Tax=Paenibacillus algorifonticola TaxID=684063 RepID=UPI003D2DAABD
MRTLTEIQRDMHDYLPRYYEDIPTATNIIDREAAEAAQINADIYDVLAQMFVDTATWALPRWERNFALATDADKPIDQRRAVIKSRIRGVGTVTAALIESIAEAYANGEVEVVEDNANYTVKLTFVSALGQPPNFADLEAAVRDAMPAHLAVEYVFIYTTFGKLEGYDVTFGGIQTAGLTYAQLEIWEGP